MVTALPVAAAVRFHLSLNVADLARSVAFYRTLFNRQPAKRRDDYAKFEVNDPPLVLSLEPAGHGSGGALNHLGFRLPDSTALVAMQQRLELAGVRSQREEGVECCYARQTKFWVTDPDNTLWEFYVLEEDIDHRGAGQAPERVLPKQAAPSADPVVWTHCLGEPVPAALPQRDGTVDEVHLRGSFNDNLPEADRLRLLREARRVLRDGGKIVLHNLVADRAFPNGPPPLPGPAAYVRRVPLEAEPQRALEEAGFAGLQLEKFGAAPCFHHDGVEMREMLLTARKVNAAPSGRSLVLYKGPFREVRDDEGNVYRRGERVQVAEQTRDLLRKGTLAEQFLFLS
jgi:catechol 2,3-dioxygenase-like lactoylglutathione lyase family enzyme